MSPHVIFGVPLRWPSLVRPLCFVMGAWALLALGAADAAAQAAKESEGPADPEEVTLPTGDGLQLVATFYPGTQKKESVPVILLHEYGGSRADLENLALYLQQGLGCAVIVPDLRGHGGSTKMRPVGAPQDIEITHTRLQRKDFLQMVAYNQDLYVVKEFLVKKNNAGECNIRKMCIVGSDVSALLSMYFARNDWSRPDIRNQPQGRDVRGLVMLSPPSVAQGLNFREPLQFPRGAPNPFAEISFLIVVGDKEPTNQRAAAQLNNLLTAIRPRLPEDPEERRKRQDLFFFEQNTRMQGLKLLDNDQLNTEELIGAFIKRRLIGHDAPWAMR